MGDLIPFPMNINQRLDMQTEALVEGAADLQQDTDRAVRLAEALHSDVIRIDFSRPEPDYDSPA